MLLRGYKKSTRSRTIWITGSTGLVALIMFLLTFTGVSETHTGDQICLDKCISYVNITSTYYRFCFDSNFSLVQTDPKIEIEIYVPTIGKNNWRLWDPERDCIERKNKNHPLPNRFMIVGYKEPTQTVKWWSDGLKVPDPLWIGVNLTVTSPINNTEYFSDRIFMNFSINASVDTCYYNLDEAGKIDIYKYLPTSYCYQETANVSTSCGGLANGSYSIDGSTNPLGPFFYAFDENYSTQTLITAVNVSFYVNYSVPANANKNSSLWQIKISRTGTATLTNLSINNCSVPLQFKVFNYDEIDGAGFGWAHAYCINSSGDWHYLWQPSGGSGTSTELIYEEAMFWNISQDPVYDFYKNFTSTEGAHNLTISCNDSSGNEVNSSVIFFNIANMLNYSINSLLNMTNADQNFAPNFTQIYRQINYTTGNFTWNMTQYNVSTYIFVPYFYYFKNNYNSEITINITSSTKLVNHTYTYFIKNNTKIEINSNVYQINLSALEIAYFNMTLDLINISQTYVNWTKTIDNANLSFNLNITYGHR